MSREYARRSRGGGNLPLIIAIIGTVIVVAVILYFLLSGGNGFLKAKETPSPELTTAPPTQTNTPGPTPSPTQAVTMAIQVTSEAPSVAITTQAPTPTPAPNYARATVWANSLNVREGPGLDYAKVGSAKRGEYFKVWEETSKWLKVQLTNGVFGWVWRDYCVRGDAALPAAPTKEAEPSFMSKAEFTGSNTIKVTFTENVWGNSGKTEKVSATVFTVKEGSTEVTITGISDCSGGKYVNLTVGNTSGGEVTVSLDKNGVYNSEGEGTPAGSYKIGTSSDSIAPTVSFSGGTTTKTITATFSENVGSNTDGTGDLDSDDFYLSGEHTATIQSVAHAGGTKTATVTISFSAMTGGEKAICTLTLKDSRAYDSGG